ncbi:YgaP family membrane protein [Mongoliimonas terrestris]|uniref:YgaP family membrane protein n=1 Tax=Mongoliimonas terrestris TaxID=1709001 RepID=UPI0009499F5C|nr:DUF2892 domain-containing protein [Mongoliimonas terrestris]
MFATNMGSADRLFRAVLGVLLLAFALTGLPATGYNWLGWIGIVPLATAAIGWCPLYVPFGIRTCRSA